MRCAGRAWLQVGLDLGWLDVVCRLSLDVGLTKTALTLVHVQVFLVIFVFLLFPLVSFIFVSASGSPALYLVAFRAFTEMSGQCNGSLLKLLPWATIGF